MENEKVCPKCKGAGFIKTTTKNEMGWEYELFKRCECMSKPKTEHKNPFDEGGKSNATGN